MWLERQRRSILDHAGPTAILAPYGYGTAEIVASLERDATLVWVELGASERGDPVAQGNCLVEAVKRALGSPMLPVGLPFQYSVEFLRGNLALLGPFTFAVTGAEHAPELAGALLGLDGGDTRTLLVFAAAPRGLELPDGVPRRDRAALRLRPDEAEAIADGRLPTDGVEALRAATDGAYLDFLTALHERLDLPLPTRPSPVGAHLPPGREMLVEPGLLLEVLIEKRRWIEALELAVDRLPERASEVLVEAGHVFHERGLHQRLDALLSRLPAPTHDETVLRWRLTAAGRNGRVGPMREEVESFLARFSAPELRAVYAATLVDPQTRMTETRRAFEVAETPLTLFQYGRMMQGLDEGADLLLRSVRLAERSGRPYEVARNAGALASQLTHLGRYRDAAFWSEWALGFFDRHELADGQRRLKLLNDWAYTCLLIGDTVGLAQPLKEAEPHLELAYPALARLFHSTLGDLYLVIGQPAKALGYYRENWEGAPRVELGRAALAMTRALLELGETRAALDLTERAFTLTAGEPSLYRVPAVLARASALSADDPDGARVLLDGLHDVSLSALHRARKALMLARLDEARGDGRAARARVTGAAAVLGDLALSGLRLLSGPEPAYRSLWRIVLGQEEELHLKLLGAPEVWRRGRRLDLPPQWLDVAAVLALSAPGGRGLTLEQLSLAVQGEEGNPTNLKAALSRLRHKLPVSHQLYRLEDTVSSDVAQLEALLRQGRVREALSLYAGPLLPDSDAPAVRRKREEIEAALRQAVLSAGDADSVMQFAEMLGDDLELWSAAREMLREHDPRAPLVRARIDRVLQEWSE